LWFFAKKQTEAELNRESPTAFDAFFFKPTEPTTDFFYHFLVPPHTTTPKKIAFEFLAARPCTAAAPLPRCSSSLQAGCCSDSRELCRHAAAAAQ
jgi:hypothetical protein